MDKPRSKRWAPISGSANADESYKEQCKRITAERVYTYECWCRPPFMTSDDDSDEESANSWSDTDSEGDEDEDEEMEEEEDDDGPPKSSSKSRCDGGKTCLCEKPARDHPDHPWITTKAGRVKFGTQMIMMSLRCPDNFDMHIYSDFEGIGVMEVLENLVIDFMESEDNWREQWVVCEALAFVMHSDMVDSLMGIDDPSSVRAICSLVARTFLSMFGRLEREAIMSEMSEVRNLGLIMALCLKWAHDIRADIDWDGELFVHQTKTSFRNDSVKLTMADGTTTTYQFAVGNFDGIILSYANKYAIPLTGPSNIDDIAAEVEIDDVELPPSGVKEDQFGLKKAYKSYVKNHGRCDGPHSKPVVGGDSFDITTMSPRERKECSFTGKDPLSKKELKMLKEGMVMQMA